MIVITTSNSTSVNPCRSPRAENVRVFASIGKHVFKICELDGKSKKSDGVAKVFVVELHLAVNPLLINAN